MDTDQTGRSVQSTGIPGRLSSTLAPVLSVSIRGYMILGSSMTADDVIRVLNLRPHPVEGGFFRETYRSATTLPGSVLPGHRGPRSASTAIYYLLKPGHVSELHVLPGDEVFHFYLGSPVRMLQLRPDGSGKEVTLGSDFAAGQLPQVVVPGGVWQGTHLLGDSGFALLGCTVAPGFDYADYRSASRAELVAKWPAFAEEIMRLTPRG
jgi:predicted cupin superfamily sugar epimerase